jgi:hypothetical protein
MLVKLEQISHGGKILIGANLICYEPRRSMAGFRLSYVILAYGACLIHHFPLESTAPLAIENAKAMLLLILGWP